MRNFKIGFYFLLGIATLFLILFLNYNLFQQEKSSKIKEAVSKEEIRKRQLEVGLRKNIFNDKCFPKESLNREKDKIFVLGLDGATFDWVLPWLEEGALPNLNKLFTSGVWEKLTSVVPPDSSTAYPCFATGKRPRNLGIFSWSKRNPGNYTIRMTNALDIPSKTFWQVASENNKKVVVINLPLTYPPPTKLNGYLIASYCSQTGKVFTYPPEITPLLTSEGYIPNEMEHSIEFIYPQTTKRIDLALYLLKNYDWDIFTFIITGTDRYQHRFGNEIESKEYWIKVDELVGKMLAALDEKTTIFIFSDHGFKDYFAQVFIHTWLYKNGFLEIEEKYLSKRYNWKYLVDWFIIPFDMEKTRIYSHWGFGGTYFGLWVNLKGREPEGIVSEGKPFEETIKELTDALGNLCDPETGVPIVDKIYRIEKSSSEKGATATPDLIIKLKDDYLPNLSWKDPAIITGATIVKYKKEYNHSMKGILMMSGNKITGHKKIEAEIIDLCPTILYLMGLPVARDMDGRVLEDAIKREYLTSHPIKYVETYVREVSVEEAPILDKLTKEQIERLRSLGYIQ